MERLFGTDGVRGVANRAPMTPEVVYNLGRAAGYVFRQYKADTVLVLAGFESRWKVPAGTEIMVRMGAAGGCVVVMLGSSLDEDVPPQPETSSPTRTRRVPRPAFNHLTLIFPLRPSLWPALGTRRIPSHNEIMGDNGCSCPRRGLWQSTRLVRCHGSTVSPMSTRVPNANPGTSAQGSTCAQVWRVRSGGEHTRIRGGCHAPENLRSGSHESWLW